MHRTTEGEDGFLPESNSVINFILPPKIFLKTKAALTLPLQILKYLEQDYIRYRTNNVKNIK